MDIYRAVRARVEQELSCSAHDLEHVGRVESLAIRIAEGYHEVNLPILRLSALLHDIARVKEDQDSSGQTDHALLGGEMAEAILHELKCDNEAIAHIKHCVISHRYRGTTAPQTLEAKILFDADKLDVIGAIGIVRSYVITGQYGEPIYSDIPLEDYIRENLTDGNPNGRVIDIHKHTANLEFELKLRHIPERLYTPEAKQIAKERIGFMSGFFQELRRELKGEA